MTYTIPEKIIETIRKSRRMVISTGAGISAESGIATFRDPVDGLWSQYDPELLSTPEAFRRDPSLVWGWYETMRGQMRNASPNPAHHAVTELTVIVPEVALITQNIDDLHERAGASDVIHLHGRVFDSRCFACARPHYRRDIPATLGGPIEPPRCGHCNGRIHPGVVWFGEQLPQRDVKRAFDAAKRCDCLISIGTSGEVNPAATLPDIALDSGASVIHVNIDPWCQHRPNEYLLEGRASEIMSTVLAEAFPSGKR